MEGCVISLSETEAYSGEKSLFVEDRTAKWAGPVAGLIVIHSFNLILGDSKAIFKDNKGFRNWVDPHFNVGKNSQIKIFFDRSPS